VAYRAPYHTTLLRQSWVYALPIMTLGNNFLVVMIGSRKSSSPAREHHVKSCSPVWDEVRA
jgi:hypothetical protein